MEPTEEMIIAAFGHFATISELDVARKSWSFLAPIWAHLLAIWAY